MLTQHSFVLAILPYVLVVVDMQPLFRASLRPGLAALVARQVAQAVSDGMPVIILECYPQMNGATEQSILAPLAGYDSLKHIVLAKCSSGGGKEVYEACQLLGFNTEAFRFCGVNTTDCVFHTAEEVSRRYPDAAICLVEAACGDEFHPTTQSAWQRFVEKTQHRLRYQLI